ncbi:MAG: Na+-transporting NADH:ubiquinone oxidoreductase subunit C [Planctomycetota bacterium]|jgi:Na+-transporting NADH:ubiquinone oxidoreductase subunit C|uniref:Na(+)-translocating NADH-quinone reductase subunit C n=1 Tax=Patiriisocius sp. Uisw_047 TaxID=3230969 RepID=UPI0039E89F9A
MAVNKDSNRYTILFSIIMVVVVGGLLSFFATSLKPLITVNMEAEKQQNILYAMNVNDNEGAGDVTFIPTDKVGEKFNTYVTKQIVIEGEKVTENDQAYLIDIKKEGTKAKKEGYLRKLPLMIGEKDGKEIYVVPVRGKGLWDAIWGFVAMDKSMTIQGVYFDHKGETPGLGAEIKQRYFMDDFTGESFLNGNSFEGIKVAKGNNDPLNNDKTDYEVDALAGATITGDGVAAMLKKDIKMYVPYFQSLNK